MVAGSGEHGDKPSNSGATELVSYYVLYMSQSNTFTMVTHKQKYYLPNLELLYLLSNSVAAEPEDTPPQILKPTT
jgi:hypothetical protein